MKDNNRKSNNNNSNKKSSSTIPSSSISDRISAHTHVTGLGLDEIGICKPTTTTTTTTGDSNCGFIGQENAREGCGIIVDMIREQKMSGRSLLLTGPPGTGKTALAMAICRELGDGKSIPFSPMIASQVYSHEVSKTSILAEYFRKAISLRIREQKEVYEGEVTDLNVEETHDPLAGNAAASYGRTISHVLLSLRTTKGSKTLKLDPTMYDALSAEHVTVGDIIYIESNSGAVKRVGRSDTYATEFDLEAEEYVPIPKGDVHKKKTIVQDVTLHDLDVANANPTSSTGAGASLGGAGSKKSNKDIMSLMSSLGGKPRKTEITEKLRLEINKVVTRYIDDGIAELVPGVLFIDEVHMLDMECFTFLHRSLESTLSPIVILATNRGVTKVHGSNDVIAPHGIPIDFLDRLLIIPTLPYTIEETIEILRIRAKTETINIDEDALRVLATDVGTCTTTTTNNSGSLRFAVQMLTPAKIIAETYGRTTISVDDIRTIQSLFLHGKESARRLEQTNSYGYL